MNPTYPAAPGPASTRVPLAPGRLPGLGHLVPLLRDPLGFMTALADVAGVVRIQLANRRLHVVTDPQLVHELLTTHAGACPRSGVQDTAREHFGAGLLTTDDAEHRARRRVLQQCFRPQSLADYVPVMSRIVRERITEWQPGQVLSLEREMHTLALDIVTETLFGIRLDAASRHAFLTAFPDAIKGMIVQGLYPHPGLGKLPLAVNRRFATAVDIMNRTADQIIRTASPDPQGMIALLRASFPAETVRAEVIAMLFAGTETSAATLNWLFHELDQNPDAMTTVTAEIDTELGPHLEPTAAHLDRLPATRRVVREVLRRHSPNAFLMRESITPTQLGPYLLPSGTELLYSLTAVHRHPALYPDPLRFDPQRWLPERAAALPRSAYLPFASGRHKCIGDDFAWTELMIVTASVLQRWHLTPEPGTQVREVAGVTVQARGLTMRATRR